MKHIVQLRAIADTKQGADLVLAQWRKLYGSNLQNVDGPKEGNRGRGQWLLYANALVEDNP